MGRSAQRLYEFVQQLSPEERRELVRLLSSSPPPPPAPAGGPIQPLDLPSFSGGAWLGGALGRDEIYQDEAGRALPD